MYNTSSGLLSLVLVVVLMNGSVPLMKDDPDFEYSVFGCGAE